MSEENVEIVRRMYEAIGRDDWEGAFRDVHPDAEWETDPRVPNAGIYRGREEIQRFFEDQAAPFEESAIEPEEFFAQGDHVVAFVRVRRRPKGSTAEVEYRIGTLWTVRNGEIVRGQGFAERQKALEAAGLRE